MVSVIAEIGKKELKTTFRSKSIIIPLAVAIGVPILLLPTTIQAIAERPELMYAYILLIQTIPVIVIASVIGMNAFVNEITWKTMKSLLVAPLSEKEIFIGKSLPCIVAGLITEACWAVIPLVLLPIAVDIPIIIIVVVTGPLLVIFTTFMIIAMTSRFPSSAGGETAAFISMGAVIGVLLLCFFLQFLLQMNPIAMQVMVALAVAALTFMTYFIATKWFNRERLVVGL